MFYFGNFIQQKINQLYSSSIAVFYMADIVQQYEEVIFVKGFFLLLAYIEMNTHMQHAYIHLAFDSPRVGWL